VTALTTPGHVLPFRPLPFIDADNRAFWTGGGSGALMLQRCNACGLWIHPAAPVCRRCRSTDVSPAQASGRGRVASYTVNYQPWIPGTEPYIIAWVELAEQQHLILTSNLVDVEAEDVRLGMEVEVVFEKHPGEEIWFPLFRPVSPAGLGGEPS
jgi:uncharacterized OB-fold protein